ncbi:oocyte zinc finger protein XlCOF8.4-like isoform X2 [Hyperolius riggenbachi]|uniref:oocyte zinc finger protein XlCOF8.4-like isoform X2 n=1 Tax=Hyperolius riggenbachi TaxID=752182 RepID=UPI0035A2E809
MEKNMSHITEKVLNLTLEMLYLLTGEVYVPKTQLDCDITRRRGSHKSGEWNRGQGPVKEPSPSNMIPERMNQKKILEVIDKITELLTGEEEWKYVEGHKNLYKGAINENQSPLTLPDGSKYRNQVERCASPLQEDNNIPQDHQKVVEDVLVIKAKIKQEAEETYGRGDEPYKDKDILPQNSKDLADSRVTRRDRRAEKDDIKCVKVKEENVPIEISKDGQYMQRNMDQCSIRHADGDIGNDITVDSSEENAMTPSLQPVGHSVLPVTHQAVQKKLEMSPCSVSGKRGNQRRKRHSNQKSVRVKSYSCSECGKCFANHSCLIHPGPHVVEMTYPCTDCGLCFPQKTNLLRHQRVHSVVKPYVCSDCGRCFTLKSDLHRHQRTHTGEKPYSCLLCGRGFTQKSNLLRHHRSHSGEKPFSCPECGKCFTKKQDLVAHHIKHEK